MEEMMLHNSTWGVVRAKETTEGRVKAAGDVGLMGNDIRSCVCHHHTAAISQWQLLKPRQH